MEKVKGLLLLERPDMSYVPPMPPTAPPSGPLSSPGMPPPDTAWTAPVGTNPPVAPTPIAPDAGAAARRDAAMPDLVMILDELSSTVAGAYGAILASVDGFSLARSSSVVNQASHSAMLAAAVGLSHQLVAMGGGQELRQLVVEHDTGLLLIWPIGSQRVLAVLTAATIDQRHLREFVQARAQWLSGDDS
jgi:predicted regulator of Ras-like GTPase activity (Roadblock/LC7/MglB family)